MLSADFLQQQAHGRHDLHATTVPPVSEPASGNASAQPTWAAAGAKPPTRSTHADKLRSLSELLAQLAQDCDRDPPQGGDHNTATVSASTNGGGSSSSRVPAPSMMELIDRVECAVKDLAAAFNSHQNASDDAGCLLITSPVGLSPVGAEQNARMGRSSQRPKSPRSRSVTPRPASSSRPISASPQSPTSRVTSHTYSGSPALPETPTRPPPSASDLALERSLASLSIDASAVDTIHDPHPTSPSLAAAAAAAAKSKSKSARTSSQLTPSSAVNPPKRSRQSMTPPSRPRFSLGVFTSTSGVSFVRTPVTLASPTRLHCASPSPCTALVPECTPPRPESLHHPNPWSNASNCRATASPTPAPRTNHVSDDDGDDDPIVFISSTPGPNPPGAPTAQRTVVILSDSDSDASPPPATKRAPPHATPAQRTPRRPAVCLPSDSDSDSDSDAEEAPATPTRRAPVRVPAGTPRNTPRRAGGAIQRKIEILRTRFTPRRDDGAAASVRRKAVVVDSDEDEDGEEEEEQEKSDGGVSGMEEEEGEDDWWNGGGQDDEDTYDSSFIDDSGDDEDELSVSRPKPKIRETPDTPRLPAAPATPALSSAAFKRARDALTVQAFAEFNERAFNNQLPSNLKIEWNKRLCTTAGRAWPTRFKPTTKQPVPPERKLADDGWVYDARVELSVKVLDSEEKLRRTLLHELCHVAAWLLDHVAKPPHGPRFWFWAKRATRAFPLLEVTTCHDYEINFKYTYVCTVCGYSFGRHSKSVDVQRQACGACNGGRLRLEVAAAKKRGRGEAEGGQEKSARKPSAYQVFVKERYGQVKQAGGGGGARPHKEVMQVLSELWAKEGKGKRAAVDLGMGAAGDDKEAVDGQEDGDGSMASA